uniref:DUF2088 domain-containing protein n=1 Tax=Steinernema glaseri TaxID=37863 RepID=A0A1I7XY19_9BILA
MNPIDPSASTLALLRADFDAYIADVREKFFEILNKIRFSERPADADSRTLRFRILCKLIPETTTFSRPREYVWEKVQKMAEAEDAVLLPLGTRIDNPIVQADVYGKHHRFCKKANEEDSDVLLLR